MHRVARDRTALTRHGLSRPIRAALDDGLLTAASTLFDYGCGHGDDLRLLSAAGFTCAGWDPNHRPGVARIESDVVNLGYVINVIEAPLERAEALRNAWDLARSLLVVAARTNAEVHDLTFREAMADGVRTSRNTFQKFYEQQELKHWVEFVLGEEAVAAAPGIFYVFRDAESRELFRASRSRRRVATPSLTLSEQRCHDHPELVTALIGFFTARGRLPQSHELAEGAELLDVFGSIKRAFTAVRRTNESVAWERISAQRREDVVLYLALSHFERGARWSTLPPTLQEDVRALFGTYRAGTRASETLLLDIAKPGAVETAAAASTVGKLTPTALYVHRSALDHLPLLLRAFEGCGRGYLGEVEGANLIKLYRREPKLSYLSYPDFDRDPHPALSFSLNVDLREFRLRMRRFAGQPNPPILHRKECFVAADHPRRETFARLTRAEEAAGLLDETESIGLRRGWDLALQERELALRGHRLVKARQTGVTASPTRKT
jgi:DNA phosphorothioation-associated putative methyltransferase